MPITVKCDCGRTLRVKEEYAGRKGRCPGCDRMLAIPRPKARQEEEDDFPEVTPVEEADPPRRRSSSIRQAPVESERAFRSRRPSPPEEEDEDRPRRSSRRADPDEDEEDRPRRAALRDEDEDRPRRKKKGRSARGSSGGGGTTGTVLGGIGVMLLAIVWFFGGMALGRIFIYPPILFVCGLIAFIKGCLGGE